jgi:uncharacterized protein
MIDYLAIIKKYCGENEELKTILISHSRQVANRALAILSKHPDWVENGLVDPVFIEEAAMLHDIGVTLCDAPRIHCVGAHKYIEHGYLGAEILRSEGLEKHAAVAERYTGTGINEDQILREDLPIPLQDYSPRTLEERLICYADKFYSKTKLGLEKPYSKIRLHLWKYGSDTVARFDEMQRLFEPDLSFD